MDSRTQYLLGISQSAPEVNVTPHDMAGVYQKAFDMVCNKKDWKEPVNAVIPNDCGIAISVIVEAIKFMTATEPMTLFIPDKPGYIRIVSEGYRLGPAGP